jgi:predicted phage-related endonuclease
VRRTAGVGASQIAVACGLSPHATELELWVEKSGGEPIPDNEAMYWGRAHEPAIIARRAEDAVWEGLTVVRPHRTYCSVRCPDLFASPDAFEFPFGRTVDLDAPDGVDWCDDAKSIDWPSRQRWLDRGPDLHYVLQVQAQCYVTGAPWGSLLVLFGAADYRRWTFEADPEVGEMLAQVAVDFMGRVRDGRPPAADPAHSSTAATLAGLHRGRQGEQRVLSPSAARALLDLQALGEQKAWVDAEIDRLRNQVRAELGDAAEGVCPFTGRTLVTWPEQKDGRVDISIADLRRDHPHLFRMVERRVGKPAGRSTRLYPRAKALDAARTQISFTEHTKEA